MIKDYTKWHRVKANLETKPTLKNYHNREIWWCSVGLNVGSEEDGKNSLFERPVLVIHKFNKHTFWGLPMSSKIKVNQYYESIVFQNIKRGVLLSQLRLFSSKRLIRKLGRISHKQFNIIKKRLYSF